MMAARVTIVVVAVAMLAGIARGQDVDPLAAARAVVQAEWADRLVDVETMEDPQRLVLAEDLVEAARGKTRPDTERFVMADLAAQTAIAVGSAEAEDIARKAMVLAQGAQAYDEQTAAQREYELLTVRLMYMTTRYADRTETSNMGIAAAEAARVYAEILLAAGEFAECETVAREGARLGSRYRVAEVAGTCNAMEGVLRRRQERETKLALARRKFTAAESSGSTEGRALARREIGDLLVALNGDLLEAQEFLTGTGHPLAEAADLSQAIAQGQPVEAEALLKAVAAIRDAVKTAEPPAQRKLFLAGVALCDAYDAIPRTPGQDASGAMYRRALRRAAGLTETADYVEAITESYVHLNADVMLLDGDRVRVSYDFSDEAQLKDWTQETFIWSVDKGALQQTGEGSQRKQGQITNALRFRADRPMTITASARGMDQIALAVACFPWGSTATRDMTGFWFRCEENRRGGDWREGLELITYRGGHTWQDATPLKADMTYDIKIVLDGTGGVEWWIDEVLVHDYDPLPVDAVFTEGSVGVRLFSRTASERSPTRYDSITIEGELLVSPTAKPAE